MAEELEITFGHAGNAAACQGEGWSTDEPDGVWMVDAASTLVVPRPERPGDYLLELALGSLQVPQRAFQRLSVAVNGAGVGTQVLRGDALVQCWVPWPALRDPPQCVITLSHPDGWSPSEAGSSDRRVLSLHARSLRLSLLTDRPSAAPAAAQDAAAAAQPGGDEGGDKASDGDAGSDGNAGRAGDEDRDGGGTGMHRLVLDFESLGPGCTLGLVQRHYGAEPLGLFRFGRTPTDALLSVLEADPDAGAFGARASLVLDPDARAYALVDQVHGFAWHTGLREGQVDGAALERQALARLPWLARRFHEVLAGGGRILVLCDEDGPGDAATVGRLLAALRRHGPVTLLWVGAAGGGHAAGDVEWAGDGLLRGWSDGSMSAWGEVCRRAHRLWQTSRTGRPA